MARTRDPAAFAGLTALCQSGSVGAFARLAALDKIAVIMAAKGGVPAGITVGDCIELLDVVAAVRTGKDRHPHSPLFYQLLRSWGAFGQDAPAAMRALAGRGKPTCEQLIDRYGIACQPVRDVLVDYLRERQASADFSSLQRLAYLLGKLFWADLEAHHPGISSLKLPRDAAAAWKQRVMTRTTTTATGDGQARADGDRPPGRAQRADRSPGVLPRHRRMGRRGPGPVGAARGALPGQRQRRLPQERPLPAQVPDGPADPGTAARAARPGRLGRCRAHRLRRAAAGRPGYPRGLAVHRRRADAAPGGDEDRDHRPDLGRRPGHRQTPRPDLRRTPRVLVLGDDRGAAAHRHPDRGTDRAVPPQPDPVPAAGHRRADPAAADRPVQDRRRNGCWSSPPSWPTSCRRSCAGSAAPRPHVPLVVSYDKNERVYNPPMPLLFQWRCRLENRPVGETVTAGLPRPRADRDRGQGRQRPAAALHLPRLQKDLHHRRDPARDAAAHRPAGRRAPRHQHHHGLQGGLPRRSHQRPPRVHRPPPLPAPGRRNTASPPTRNGPSSSATSNTAKSPSATAAAPTTPPASTSTPACAARCCDPTPPSVPASCRSATT